MTREEAMSLIPVYADGELVDPQRAEVEALLAREPELAQRVELYRALRRSARRGFAAASVPHELESRVRGVIRRREMAIRLAWFAGAGALAACLLLLAIWLVPWSRPRPMPLIPASVFVAAHHKCAGYAKHTEIPLSGRCCPETASLILSSQYSHPVLVPDFQFIGLRLDGVCRCFDPGLGVGVIHSHYVDEANEAAGHPPAQVASAPFGVGATPGDLSFFSMTTRIVLADPSSEVFGDSRGYEVANVDGVTVLKWDEGDLSFALVGQRPEADLRVLAEGVRIAHTRHDIILAPLAMLPLP